MKFFAVVIACCELMLISGMSVLTNDQENAEDPRLPVYNAGGWHRLWPQGIIPFEYTPDLDNKMKIIIKQAIDVYHTETCIKWIHTSEIPNPKDRVTFRHGTGCNAPVGLYEGKSTLYITLQFPGCDDIGVILHEMMHVVGFNHEQNRWDRNKYIKVLFNNIKEEFRFAFEITKTKPMAGWEEKYAYEPTSIMHYANKAFAIVTGTDTMKSLTNVDINSMGKSKHLTKMDIRQINALYKCESVDPSTQGPGSTAGPTLGPSKGGDELPRPESILFNTTLYINVKNPRLGTPLDDKSSSVDIYGSLASSVLALSSMCWIATAFVYY